MRNSILFLLTLLALSLSASEHYVFKTEELYKGAYAPRVREHSVESDSIVCKATFSPYILKGAAGWSFVLKGKGFDYVPIFFAKNESINLTKEQDTYIGVMYDGAQVTGNASLTAFKKDGKYTSIILSGDGFSITLMSIIEAGAYEDMKKSRSEIKQYRSDSITGLVETGKDAQLFIEDFDPICQFMRNSKEQGCTIHCKIDTSGHVVLDDGNSTEAVELFGHISFAKVHPWKKNYKAINKSLPIVTQHTIVLKKSNLGSCLKGKDKFLAIKAKYDKKTGEWSISIPELNEKNLNLDQISNTCAVSAYSIKRELTDFVQGYLIKLGEYKACTLHVDIKIRGIEGTGACSIVRGREESGLSAYYLDYVVVDK